VCQLIRLTSTWNYSDWYWYLQIGMTPLILAASKGHASLVKSLLEAKADVNHADDVSRLSATLNIRS
jgi:Ankyrin repeat